MLLAMVFIRECDSSREVNKPKIDFEICKLWIQRIGSLNGGIGQVDWKFIETQIFGSYNS